MARIFFMALLVLLSLPARALEPLTWIFMPFPGVVNLRDGQLQDGLLVEYLRLLDTHITDVPVHNQVGNIARGLYDLAHKRNVCIVGVLQAPERDQIAYFVPFLAIPPMQVVVRASEFEHLPMVDGRLWLEDLLTAKLRGGFLIQRVYPAQLQVRLHAQLTAKIIAGINLTSNGDRLLQMLSHQRFDYTFEYSPIVLGFAQANQQAEALRSVPLADMPGLALAGTYCTRNPWGRAMATRIDKAVRLVLAEPDSVTALYQRWLPAESWQHYEAEIKQFIRQRAKQAPMSFTP
ncbi:MAG: hypothetical protein ACI9EB_000875 [Pseudomonas sp.]|jgi:uncharacterized protein (TIGR02285 family)